MNEEHAHQIEKRKKGHHHSEEQGAFQESFLGRTARCVVTEASAGKRLWGALQMTGRTEDLMPKNGVALESLQAGEWCDLISVLEIK